RESGLYHGGSLGGGEGQEPTLSDPGRSGGGRRDLARSDSDTWSTYFSELARERRATVATVDGGTPPEKASRHRRYWVAAEKAKSFTALIPSAKFETTIADIETTTPSPDNALLALVA